MVHDTQLGMLVELYEQPRRARREIDAGASHHLPDVLTARVTPGDERERLLELTHGARIHGHGEELAGPLSDVFCQCTDRLAQPLLRHEPGEQEADQGNARCE